MSLRRSTLYSTAGVLIRLGISLAAGPLLIRGLGLERYGLWVVLVSLVGVALVAQLGLDSALTNFLAGAHARNDAEEVGQAAGTALVLLSSLGLCAALVLSFSLPWLVARLFPGHAQEAELIISGRVLGLGLLPRFWQQWAVASEAGLLRYDRQAQIESSSIVLLNLGLIALAWAGQGLVTLAIWSLFATLVTLLAHLLFLRKVWRQLALRFSLRHELAGRLFRFGLTQWLSNIGGLLFSQMDRLLVNAFLGPAAVGLYATATSVTARINELSSVPIQSIAPAISAALASGHKASVPYIFQRALRLNALIVYLLSAGLLLWAQSLAVLLVSMEHAGPVALLLQIVVPLYALYSLNAPGYFAAMGLGRPELNAVGALAGGLATLLLMLWFIPAWKLTGAAWGNSGYLLTNLISIGAASATGLGVRRWLREIAPFALSLVTVCAVSLLLEDEGYLLLLLASGLSLFPAAWIDRQSLVDLTQIAMGWIRRLETI